MRYTIVRSSSIEKLEVEVEKYMEMGYFMAGDLQVVFDCGFLKFFQPMMHE